jgi:hypothetical protein
MAGMSPEYDTDVSDRYARSVMFVRAGRVTGDAAIVGK